MSFRFAIALIVTCIVIAVLWEFSRPRNVPNGVHSPEHIVTRAESVPPEAVGPFYVGISALDVGDNERAGRVFDELSKKLSTEPAIWANLGLARLRLGDIPGAEESLSVAAKLSPTNGQVTVLQAVVDEYQGQFPQAIARLRSLPNPDVAVLYRLAQLLDRTGPDADPREQLEIFDRIQKLQPKNLIAAFSKARLLARTENKTSLTGAINALDSYRAGWGNAAIQQYESAKTATASGDFKTAATDLAFLQNLNVATPAYQAALSALGMSGGSLGEPIRGFLAYREPETVIPAADESLKFEVVPEIVSVLPDFYLAKELSTNARANIISLAMGVLYIRDLAMVPLASARSALGRNSFCAADLNGDGFEDLAFVDGNGLKLWMQGTDGKFTAYQPSDAVRASFAAPGHGVWAVDYDADGDLDLIVARDGAAPQLLRNNGDGNFTAVDTLASFPDICDVCWGDFDGDGSDDLAMLDVNGRVLISWNNRSGAFAAPVPVSESPAVALTYGDVVGTGEMSLIVLDQNGAIENLSFDREKRTWTHRELARWTDPPNLADGFRKNRASIFVADLDNNGAPDIVASAANASSIWLNQGNGNFQNLPGAPALFVTSIADTDGDGFLDLVGLTATSWAAVAHTHGTKGYHWQSIQARTQGNVGDGRVNSFGIGGRIEIRAGRLVSAAPITSPRTHFGLGDQSQVGAARIVWPNGVAQVEFDLQSDQDITAVQRLKGSCPWVFAKAGDKFQFVKDFIWRSPLGMRINSEDTAGIDQTEDWILVPGKYLTAENGAYEIRITAELWETHFFDHVAMRVVDHPESVAAFVDERFVPTKQPKLEVICTTPPRPFAEAMDQSGRDVLKTLAVADEDCVTNFPLGRFQGLTSEHWVEFQLPDDAPAGEPLVLVGEGWIYPADSSLNVAISQGTNPAPHGLVLEDYDAQNGWRTVSGDLGFPAGKNKTVVIPFPRESLNSGHRRFRLRTNLEVYWDCLGWAVAKPGAEIKSAPAEMLSAELRYRGFSKLVAPDRRKPDLPEYDKLSGAGAKWRDLEGYYTRYGDVRELLQQTDDRYVIMNAGDEIVLRFAAPPPPSNGWTRDFVLIGDGWVKDGDFNTANSRTVGPLPSHSMKHYGGPTLPLDDDPMFQHNTDDWRRFQTRYVTPTAFDRGLMNGARTRLEGVPQ